jgi:hypothetical protein
MWTNVKIHKGWKVPGTRGKYVSYFLCPLTDCWAPRRLPQFGHCEESTNKHGALVSSCMLPYALWTLPRRYGRVIRVIKRSQFHKELRTDFHQGCTALHSHQQCIRAPFPASSQLLSLIAFLVMAHLTRVRGNLSVVWFAFPSWLRKSNISSCVYY